MSGDALYLKALRVTVHSVEDGVRRLILLERGHRVPDGADPEQVARLVASGDLGTKEDAEKAGIPVLSSPADTPLEERKPAPAKEEVPDPANPAALSVAELADWITAAQPGVRKIRDIVADDPELAARFLEAEKTATSGDSRKSLVEALDRVVKKAGSSQ